MKDLLKPGSKVKISQPDIDGVIERVSIGLSLCPLYEVVWWSGRDKKSDWFYRESLHTTTTDSIKIGFKSE